MANLCVIAAKVVNGVAQIHSDIVKNETFNDFYKMWPDKFQNKTNGVTPRRWLKFANPKLSAVISKWLGSDEWVTDTTKLEGLRKVGVRIQTQVLIFLFRFSWHDVVEEQKEYKTTFSDWS